MTLDSLITIGILIGAAVYLYRNLTKSAKSGCCGCSSAGSCTSAHDHATEPGSCGSKPGSL